MNTKYINIGHEYHSWIQNSFSFWLIAFYSYFFGSGFWSRLAPPQKGLFDYVPPTCFSISEEPNVISQYVLYILSEKAT